METFKHLKCGNYVKIESPDTCTTYICIWCNSPINFEERKNSHGVIYLYQKKEEYFQDYSQDCERATEKEHNEISEESYMPYGKYMGQRVRKVFYEHKMYCLKFFFSELFKSKGFRLEESFYWNLVDTSFEINNAKYNAQLAQDSAFWGDF